MKRLVTFLSLALSVILVCSFTMPTAVNAANADLDYQRYITFHNDFDFPIYPVIQVPTDLCGDPTDGAVNVRRILVNEPGSGMGPRMDNKGLQPGDTITVFIPNEKQTVNVKGAQQVRRCWYQSGRVYIFPVDLFQFESAMVAFDVNNIDQTTKYDNSTYPTTPVTCFQGQRDNQGKGASGNCFTGVAKNSFAADVPAQLAEYTFDSDNGDSTGDPDTGIPMADIDVSFVDDLYLPVAASVVNNGATGYMGGAMDLPTFQQRLSNFFATTPWPKYSAYLSQSQVKGNNALYGLFPPALVEGADTPAPHLPAGYNSIQNTLGRSLSSLYKPADNSTNYLISGVTYNSDTRVPSNPQVQPYIDQWMSWINGDPCTNLDQLIWPDGITGTFDKQNFCNQFKATAQSVWDHFLNDPTDGFQSNQLDFYTDCGLYNPNQKTPPPDDPNLKNACIIQHIVGYNSKVEGGELPGQVQALLRDVAYDSTDGHQQYQFDPFLTFAAPHNSQFNLDPFTRLIHNKKDGIGATAYSFSIDDKYGNFRDASLGFMIDAGGSNALENKQPFDPYQQYKMNWGFNKDPFNLISLASGVNLANIQTQLQTIAEQNQNSPLLIKQDQNLSVFGHSADTSWKLTEPLVTQSQLQTLAEQETERTKGATHFYQDLSDRTFGSKSIFPAKVWNGNAGSQPSLTILNFELSSDWPDAQALLYDFISEQNADVPLAGNWISANVCGVEIPIVGSGAQRLPLQFVDGAYQPCTITLANKSGDSMTVKLTPESKSVTDNYTGATVQVWSLPIGQNFSGTPLTTSNLNPTDYQYCKDHSSAAVSGLCDNVNVSAVWSGDPLARDVVYMGLDPKDMPRVNVIFPPAPPNPPDPNQVSWPSNATIAFQPQTDGKVLVSWPAALVGDKPAGTDDSLTYPLYVQQQDGSWSVASCDQSKTSCSVSASGSLRVYVIALNSKVSPPKQTTNLYGCYPAASPCPPGTASLSRTTAPRR